MSVWTGGEIAGVIIGIICGVIIFCYCMTCLFCSSSEDASEGKKKIKFKRPRYNMQKHKKHRSHSFSLNDEDIECGNNDGNYEVTKEDDDCCQEEDKDDNCCDFSGGNDSGGCDSGGGDEGGGGCDSGCGGGDD